MWGLKPLRDKVGGDRYLEEQKEVQESKRENSPVGAGKRNQG